FSFYFLVILLIAHITIYIHITPSFKGQLQQVASFIQFQSNLYICTIEIIIFKSIKERCFDIKIKLVFSLFQSYKRNIKVLKFLHYQHQFFQTLSLNNKAGAKI